MITPKSTAPPAAAQPRTVPIDLDLQVGVRGDGKPVLEYSLNSPSGVVEFRPATVCSDPLNKPDVYWARLHDQLEKLREGKLPGGEAIQQGEIPRQLEKIGERLFRHLFPPELRQAWDRLADVQTLQITSDEPWIPWELVKAPNESFFCLRFRLSRGLPKTTQAERIRVMNLAVIEAADIEGWPHLAQADSEVTNLVALGRELGVGVRPLRNAVSQDVIALLRDGGYQLYHFVGHGQNTGDPDDSRFLLADGRPLRSGDLFGEDVESLRHDRPLVVLNACQVGRQDWSLTGLGGWAESWLSGCNAGAFLGPQWKVDDTHASTLVERFYDELANGQLLGEALRRARQELYQTVPHDLTWLAYSLYAHPNTQIIFGNRKSFAEHDEAAASKTQVISLLSQSRASNSKQVRFTSHQARFVANSTMCYFVNITNRNATPLEITHVWYEDDEHRIPVRLDSRPLPKRLETGEAWSSWIPLNRLPEEGRTNAYARFRLRLATGEIFISVKDDSIQPYGSVPGGKILASDIHPNEGKALGRTLAAESPGRMPDRTT